MRSIILFIGCIVSANGLSQQASSLVEQWAPLVWLHSEEPFNPSSVQFHLQNTQVNDEYNINVQYDPTPSTILTGEKTSEYHLNTRVPLTCVNCFQPFFSGQPLAEAPVYAFAREYNNSCATLDVQYSFFYPFNYGKDVCVGLEIDGHCLGDVRTFGNHVGDWEHISVRIENGQAVLVHADVHSFGATYQWNGRDRFEFLEGEPVLHRQLQKNGTYEDVMRDVEYPAFLDLEDGRIAVFSANGSHGTWTQPGKHTYINILTVHLDDFTERGQRWQTWNNLVINDVNDDLNSFTGENSWINFLGPWGNTHKLECELDPIIGECGLVGGPTGPHKYFGGNFGEPDC